MSVDWGPYFNDNNNQCINMYNSNENNNLDIKCGRPSILTIDIREWRRKRKLISEDSNTSKCVSDCVSDVNKIKTQNYHLNWQFNNNILKSKSFIRTIPNRTHNENCYCPPLRLNQQQSPRLARPVKLGTSKHHSSSLLMFICIFVLLWCSCGVSAQLRPDTDLIHRRTEEGGVCRNVDIRNNVTTFKRLAGCRVVEGYVQILLMDADEKEEEYLKTLSFPELREITGYLLLYRVQGLRSLSRLFPNLAVIRGHTLFYNYALVIFEMRHLQEVGLSSLTHILRGSVRIEKNPLLCYVDTVDWDLIAQAGKGEHFITGNKRRNECPICPSNPPCPRSPTTNEPLCWTHQHCQKVCNCGSRSCRADGKCCHELCLGGCDDETQNSCLVCKDVVFQNKCIARCPVGTYEYLNRRCVEEAECRSMPVNHDVDMPRAIQWKPFNNSCILECPVNHVEVQLTTRLINNTFTCKPCNGSCRKECSAASVDSIASAQKLRGCTHIMGALEIQIRGGKNIVKELEESLNLIEEIHGYLKIVRSFPLISLNFLKNLTIIHGTNLDNGRDALIVRDNQNLQELWDWSTKPQGLQIKRGKLFFHFNPKLCLYKIKQLQEKAKLPDFTDSEVARDSNGDKVACNVTELNVRVETRTPNAVLIAWDPFIHHDPRALLGYVIYYIEAPSQNITLYDGRDACGGDGWLVDDVSVNTSPDEEGSPFLSHIITQLKPFTQYAFYVKTYTLATEGAGAHSRLQYFRTLPDVPSMPLALKAYSNSSSEIVIQWLPPLEPNGNVTHYLIEAFWERVDPEFLEQRDYCTEPLMLPDKKPLVPTPPPSTEDDKQRTAISVLDDKGTCSCDEKDKKSTQLKEKEIQFQILFEDFLHNTVYVKGPSAARKKREVLNFSSNSRNKEAFDMKKNLDRLSYSEFPETTEKDGLATAQPPSPNLDNSVLNAKGRYDKYRTTAHNTIKVLKSLRHFGEYTISVSACRELDPQERMANKPNYCSTKSIVTYRTLKTDSADNIDPVKLVVEVANQTQEYGGEVRLKWEEPSEPNGMIVTYHIEYRRVDIENYKPTVECITRKQFIGWDRSYTLKNLQPGNYSLRLRATSLAGNGAYTAIKYFLIDDPPSAPVMSVKLIVILFTLFVVAVVCGVYFYVQRRKRLNIANMKLIATVNPEYVSTVYVPDEWEVPRKKIELKEELGQGSFGMVYKGIAKDVQGVPETPCAVKTVGANASDRERIEFLNEASVMKEFKTQHVVRLLGVVSQGCPSQPALVVMELMANGDLKSYLRSHRPNECSDPSKQPPSLKRILQMAIEIADGMAYLAAKKFVHRDLAARNCMVADDLTVKIGDFGMTRDIYETDYYRKDTKGLLPVRWMAPESLKDGIFTSFSDVWSYGVVLWEMATLASQPYQGLSNDQVLRYVIEGGVMEPPENCPKKLYELMRMCWQHRPQTRPSFMELVSRLLNEVGPSFAEVSFYHSDSAKEVREQARIATAAKEEKATSPSTPLRIAHDIEDFSLGSGSEPESDEEAGEAAALTAHSPPRNSNALRSVNISPIPEVPPTDNCSPTAPPVVSVYSSDSSKGSKVSNGSTANGFINRHNNGPTSVKTTEC